MPAPRTLLIFDLGDARFGVDAMLVRESVWLPELAPVEEAPPHIVGIFSLRGQIVPVIDLNLRFGHPALPYRPSDQIVVLELDQLLMGLIVGEVREVIELSAEAVQPPPKFDVEAPAHAHLVEGEVRVGDDLVTLLDARQLVHQSNCPLPNPPPMPSPQSSGVTSSHSTSLAKNASQVAGYPASGRGSERERQFSTPAEEGTTPPSQPSPASGGRSNAPSLARSAGEGWGGGEHFCPQATPEEHAIFRTRAKALMEAAVEEEGAYLSLAVVELCGEYFGVELQAVQEFCDIAQPSPIPCCPPHILGAINLRGNLLTLLDLRAALNLPRTTQNSGKAVIARASISPGTGPSTKLRTGLGEQAVGVAVDEVHNVVYLREEELQAAPPALREQHGAEVKGTTPYGGKMMAILDLPALLAREEWIVNESV